MAYRRFSRRRGRIFILVLIIFAPLVIVILALLFDISRFTLISRGSWSRVGGLGEKSRDIKRLALDYSEAMMIGTYRGLNGEHSVVGSGHFSRHLKEIIEVRKLLRLIHNDMYRSLDRHESGVGGFAIRHLIGGNEDQVTFQRLSRVQYIPTSGLS